jgi:hypothetical protein
MPASAAEALPLTCNPALTDLLTLVNHPFDSQFNGILVNHYVERENYISAHGDNENPLAYLVW